jgi:hypothetical protein
MKVRSSESVNEIKMRVSETAILSHYLHINSLPVVINSPLRKDNHPSFLLYTPDGNKVYYKDYATGDRGDIYTLLEKRDNITFSQLIRKIATDSIAKPSLSFHTPCNAVRDFRKSKVTLKVKVREWKDYDLEYWKSYGISLKWLKYAEVYPISHKIVYKDGEKHVYPAAKYAYAFVERKENNITIKVYQPLVKNKRYKWMNTSDGSVVGLWTKIPLKGDKLFICSSLKDALCFWSNIRIPAIYVQSETTGLSDTALSILKSRYKEIYICFDNDAPGLLDGKRLAEKTGFKNIILPAFEGGKDISDMYRIKGKKEFINIIKSLF